MNTLLVFSCQTLTQSSSTGFFWVPHVKEACIRAHVFIHLFFKLLLTRRKRRAILPNDWESLAKTSRKLSRLTCYSRIDVQSCLNSMKELIQTMTVEAIKEVWALSALNCIFWVAAFCFCFQQVFCSVRVIWMHIKSIECVIPFLISWTSALAKLFCH